MNCSELSLEINEALFIPSPCPRVLAIYGSVKDLCLVPKEWKCAIENDVVSLGPAAAAVRLTRSEWGKGKEVAWGPVQAGSVPQAHSTFICVCQRRSGTDRPKRWSHHNGEMWTMSHFYDPVPGHPLPVLSGIPTLLKAQLLFQWVFSCWDGTLHWAIHSPMGWFATAEQKSHRNLPLSYASSFDMGRIWWPLTEMFPWGHLKAGAKGTHTCVFISGERRFSLC